MADTIVNTGGAPTPMPILESNDNGLGIILGIVLFVVILMLVAYFGLGALRSVGSGTNINVPRQVDVNVNTPK